MAVTGMAIGMQDFGLAIGQLRAFWKVQRWTACESKAMASQTQYP